MIGKALGIGLIGCGRISGLHILGYQDLAEAEIRAVCDSNCSRAIRTARKLGIDKHYTDYRKLLSQQDIDVVEILTPHHLHAEMAIAAAEAGKHVSVQKPIATSVTEAEAMLKAAEKAGVKFRVYENYRFYPPHVKAKELIEEGMIGKPVMLRLKLGNALKQGWKVPLSALWWRFNEESCGGGPVLFDHGYHQFSLGRFFMGDVEKVLAWIDQTKVTPFHSIDAPAVIMWKYKGAGKYGVMEVTYSPKMLINSKYYPDDERVEITGTDGVIWINRCTAATVDLPPVMLYRNGQTICFNDLRAEWEDSFIDATRNFVEAILQDREPEMSGEEGKKVLQFALAAMRSAVEKREVSPEEIIA